MGKRNGKGGWSSGHLIIAGLLFAWILSLYLIKIYFGIETDCRPGRWQYTKLQQLEVLVCAYRAGPPGYLYISVLLGVPLAAAAALLLSYFKK